MHTAFRAVAAAIATGAASPAAADLVLNMVIVDLVPGQPPRADIEASNTGSERIYVVAEPAEIVNPGRPDERRVASPDPAALGLLVTPQKMILEPGERKLVRIAAIAPPARTDRIYRVTIKPVAGDVSAATSALKILVGYDVLVVARPAVMTGTVTATRTGASIDPRQHRHHQCRVVRGPAVRSRRQELRAAALAAALRGRDVDDRDRSRAPGRLQGEDRECGRWPAVLTWSDGLRRTGRADAFGLVIVGA